MTHLAKPVGGILLALQSSLTTDLFIVHPSQSPALLGEEFVLVGIGSTSDLGREASIVTGCGQWCAGPLSFVLIVRLPLRAVIETLVFKNESAVLADGFLYIRDDTAIAL